MNFDFQLFRYGWVKSIVPSCVLAGLGYINFASFYSLGYREIYERHSTGAAVCLWVLLAISLLLVLCYWVMIFRMGPGKCPKLLPFDLYQQNLPEYSPVPDRFPCDENGFPYYCSTCQSIRPPRSFHSKDVGYCVRKFDHYCLWIGTVIGQNNYLFFMKFMMWFWIYFCVLLVFLAVYTPLSMTSDRPEINHNFIVLYVMCGFWLIMIAVLFLSHILYICINSTTFDDVTSNQYKRYTRWKKRNEKRKGKIEKRYIPRLEDGRRHLNIRKDDHRVVVEYNIKEISYSLGIKRNWINTILNNNSSSLISDSNANDPKNIDKQFFKSLLVFCIPLIDILYVKKIKGNEENTESLTSYNDSDLTFSESSESLLRKKIAKGQCHLPSYMSPTNIESYESSKNNSVEK